MRRAALLLLLLAGACASLDKKEEAFLEGDRAVSAAQPDTGSCKPFFVSPSLDWGAGAPRHSCWHRLWEIPAALVAVPLALGILTAPVWVPILLIP